MFRYFKELLSTLKRIDANLDKIGQCVKHNKKKTGDSVSISTRRWSEE